MDLRGRYQVSNLGNVKSLKYHNTDFPQNLKPKKNNMGYLWVELRMNGIKKPMLIHRLVAMAFLENPNNEVFVNHKDENPENNIVDNLEWCSQQYNVTYSMLKHPERKHIGGNRLGTRIKYKYKNKVVQKTKDGKIIRFFDSVSDCARETQYSNYSITECCKGNRKTAYGYKWEFCE